MVTDGVRGPMATVRRNGFRAMNDVGVLAVAMLSAIERL
jgi:hypothetical protein